MIGCLGDIVFEVSERTVQTLANLNWDGSARYSTHSRHGRDALTEFTGLDPDVISFSMQLLTQLGSDIHAEIGKLWTYERTGKAVSFVLGSKAYGKYRWNIVKHRVTGKFFDADGNLSGVNVTVNLKEYLRS